VSLVHVVDVVLLLLLGVEVILATVLVLEYFCKDTLGRGGKPTLVVVATVTLDTHPTAVHAVELVLHIVVPRRSLATSRSRVVSALSD